MPENTEAAPDDVDVVESRAEITDASSLLTLFGNESKVRILSVLLAAPEPLNPSRIVEAAGLGSMHGWYDNKDELLATGLIEQTGNAGNSPLYALVEDDPRVEALQQLVDLTNDALRGR